ncbi:Hsp33 family molecular chaperone [Pseudovibrio exalbescens]|uniref:Hsp33 family molecular chaperone n=1 Tax=Pseudovibrio exalbescens TaxID=197461 RepID=UPI0023667A32|nr:Hsp33 family molecular chaperone [Pseudovibrio exalbescens]MDD7911162.1 Hsp33 family molecular chaperone [Pseudovibrio exalbescens]
MDQNSTANQPLAGDDAVVPFAVETLDVRGRAVTLGPVLDSILGRHNYPEAVNKLLAQAVTLTAMLGSTLKFDGRLTLQTQTDGAVSMMVVDFNAPDGLRATATFDANQVAEVAAKEDFRPEFLLGRGHLAFTIDQGQYTSRYQGIVVLDGISLEEAAHDYFLRSEQIPTRVRLAVGEVLTRQDEGPNTHQWRAGGIMVQFLPHSPERMRQADIHPGDAPHGTEMHEIDEDDAWLEARSLVDTVRDVELTDPALPVEQLLFRLFHERGVKAFEPHVMSDRCTCSEDKIVSMLQGLGEQDRSEMTEEGAIAVKCDFCGTDYNLDPEVVFKA